MQSTRSRIARAALTFSCRVDKVDGEERRKPIPSKALTVRRAGVEAEKTNPGALIRCGRLVYVH